MNRCELPPITKSSPVGQRLLHELEGYGQGCHACSASFRFVRAQTRGGKPALDHVGAPDVLPVRWGRLVGIEQHLIVLAKTRNRLGVPVSKGLQNNRQAFNADALFSAMEISRAIVAARESRLETISSSTPKVPCDLSR